MTAGLKRYQAGGDLHFITTSCYGRRPLLASVRRRELFLRILERVRRRYHLVVVGYVVMPEHVHLLLSEPNERKLSVAVQALKLGFARNARRKRSEEQGELFEGPPQRMWQARYYDFNVRTAKKWIEKLRYMHRNPVKRGLVGSPELWRWSSFRAYAFGESGIVKVNDWSVLKLKRKERVEFGGAGMEATHVSNVARHGAPTA